MTFETIDEMFVWLDKSRAGVVNQVENLTDEQLNFHEPERWSAANIVEHLAMIENGILQMIEKGLSQAEAANAPAPAKISPPVSFEQFAEVSKTPKIAPDFVTPTCTMSAHESLKSLEQSRGKLKNLRPRLESVDLSNAKFAHPYFGELDLYHWIPFIGMHEARHLRQIKDVLTVYKASHQ